MNKPYRMKLMNELKETFFEDFIKINPGKPVDLRHCITYEKMQNMTYFTMCFNEALRIEPPVIFSGMHKITVSTDINGVPVRKGDNVIINFHQLHHDPDQWQSPYTFIPDRFDHSSPYYLKPNGDKRHPLAFSPFLGGKRICIGKTFAEIVSKYVISGLLSRLEFEFENQEYMVKKPILNVDMIKEPVIMMRIRRAKFE